MPQETILLIDDDETLLDLLGTHLRKSGYGCAACATGAHGLQFVRAQKPDLVVLDVMMPVMDGWETCERLRNISPLPIIMLTAKGEEFDKLRGFGLGVDDYVTKPFSFAELVARIGAVLARSQRPEESRRQVVSGDLCIDLNQHRVKIDGTAVELTPTEYHLLAILARNANRTVTTEQLLDRAWGPQYQGQPGMVKHYIWSLRKKIECDPGDPQHIVTDRGFGYRFE